MPSEDEFAPAKAPTPARRPPARLDLAAIFSTEPPELDYVLPGMLSGTVGALVSPGGSGKSMFALQILALVGGGADLVKLGGETKRGRAVMLAAEDPKAALMHRLHAIGKHLDAERRERMAENVDVIPLVGLGLDVMDDTWFDWIRAIATGARLILIDTLRRVHLLDENSSSDMALLLSRLEQVVLETGCSIVFLHHASKAAAMNGLGDVQQASRGSSVLVDNIRWQSFMSSMTKAEAASYNVEEAMRPFFVRWGVSKQNYGSPIAQIWLRRHEGGVLLPAVLGLPKQLPQREEPKKLSVNSKLSSRAGQYAATERWHANTQASGLMGGDG